MAVGSLMHTIKSTCSEVTYTISAHIPLVKACYMAMPNSKDIGHRKYSAIMCLREENPNIHMDIPNDYRGDVPSHIQ